MPALRRALGPALGSMCAGVPATIAANCGSGGDPSKQTASRLPIVMAALTGEPFAAARRRTEETLARLSLKPAVSCCPS